MLSNKSPMDERRRQIDTLKIFNNNVSETKPNEEYTVGFNVGACQSKLNVYLGPNFPNEKPKIVVSPPMKHDWIPDTSTGVILSAPGLLNFTIHSDLGRVVDAIIREFEKNAQPVWTSSDASSTSPLPSSMAASSVAPANQLSMQHHIHSDIPELCNLTIDDLRQLNEDDDFLNDFVDELTPVKRIQEDLDRLIDDVMNTAKSNLECEQQIHAMKQSVNAKMNDFRKHGEFYEMLNQRYQKKSEEFAPQHIRELLQIAASTADSLCEKYVEEFLSGSIDAQTFLDRYKDAKQLSALRKAKEERLSHQLTELERATY